MVLAERDRLAPRPPRPAGAGTLPHLHLRRPGPRRHRPVPAGPGRRPVGSGAVARARGRAAGLHLRVRRRFVGRRPAPARRSGRLVLRLAGYEAVVARWHWYDVRNDCWYTVWFLAAPSAEQHARLQDPARLRAPPRVQKVARGPAAPPGATSASARRGRVGRPGPVRGDPPPPRDRGGRLLLLERPPLFTGRWACRIAAAC